MKLKAKVIQLAIERPDLTARQIAEALVVHPGYVRRLGVECGLKYAPAASHEERAQ